jgi:hypothetical protein
MAGQMTPRIDVTAQLVSAKKIKVTGPINWSPAGAPGTPAETAVWFSAVVSQVVPAAGGGFQVVTAIGGGDEVYLNGASPPQSWDVTAERIGSSGNLQAGGAIVAAWATIAYSDGGAESYAWTLPVLVQ